MQTIPGYHIKTLLGEGGMTKVYLATQKLLNRQETPANYRETTNE